MSIYSENNNKLTKQYYNKCTILKGFIPLKNGVFESMREDFGGDG